MGEGEGRNLLSSLQPGARDLAQPGLIFLLFALSYGRYSLLCGPPRAPREDPTLLPSSQPIHCAAAVGCQATSGQTDFLYTFNKEDFPYPTLHRGSVNFLTAMGDQESKYETRKKKHNNSHAVSLVGLLQPDEIFGGFGMSVLASCPSLGGGWEWAEGARR